jgi:hypothetical protein
MLSNILGGMFHHKLSENFSPALKKVALVFTMESLELWSSVYKAVQAACLCRNFLQDFYTGGSLETPFYIENIIS